MTRNLTCSSGRSVPTSGPSLCSPSRQANALTDLLASTRLYANVFKLGLEQGRKM